MSGTIVCQDADLERAAAQICRASFRKAGQVCTSVQRLYVHEDVLDEFLPKFQSAAAQLVVGDPEDRKTDVGPMISEPEAQRAEEWVNEAVSGGARIVIGGSRSGPVLSPTILADVPPSSRVACEEIFAPVVSVIPYRSFNEALRWVNDSRYGLQAGVFTRDLDRALHAARTLRVGGIVINDTSSTRADLMPYGGVKDSGIRERGAAVFDSRDDRGKAGSDNSQRARRAGAKTKGDRSLAVDWQSVITTAFKKNEITAAAYVPDEVTGGLLSKLEEDPYFKAYSVTREEEGVGVLSGAYVGGMRGALVIQASGVGNSLNALGSLNVPCKIPLLLLIGERGGLNEFNPCQVPLGRAVPNVLDAIGIQSFRLDDEDEVMDVIDGASTLAFSTQRPVGLILSTQLTGGKTV